MYYLLFNIFFIQIAYNPYGQGQVNGASNYYGQQVNSDSLSQGIQYVTPPGQGSQRIYNNANQYGINPNMGVGRGVNPYGLQGNLMGSRQNDGDMFNVSSRDIDRSRGANDRNKDPYGSRNDMYGGRDNGRGMGRDNRDNFNGGRGNQNQNSSAVNPMRDPLVDEFRSTYGKSRQWGLVDLLGHVVAFCQDQHGSRFIQQRLEVCIGVDKQLIFDEIMPSAHLLMTDVFGNYVLQKLFEFGTPEQCENLANLLTDQSVQLSMQMYGCRVVQKALEYVSTSRLITLVQEFESPPVLLRCVHDANGNHVIQKCIEIVSRVAKEAPTPEMTEYLSSRIQFIIDTFKGRVKELSSHPYGCRVVQRILEHCSNTQKGVVLEELRECCSELVQDCYGNYVIQFVMQHGLEADRQVLIREVQTNLLDFSQHKFASNVVEKCLQYASKRDRDEMIWTIINVTFDLNSPVDAKTGHCVLESMVRDPYANYVVQKVIDVSDERQRSAIMHYVRENIIQLRRYTYGKHIIVRLEKITNEKF
jgi:pumilio RNA-binding family